MNGWALADGGTVWAFAPPAQGGMAVPAVADAIRVTAGDVRYLTGDFGNLPELDGADLSGGSISVSPAGVTAGAADVGAYAIGAFFTATTPGEYVVTFTGALADGTTLNRKAALVVE